MRPGESVGAVYSFFLSHIHDQYVRKRKLFVSGQPIYTNATIGEGMVRVSIGVSSKVSMVTKSFTTILGTVATN